MRYSSELHQHRLAAWDASTAAARSPLCRFKVQQGANILERSGFTERFSLSDLPRICDIDQTHCKWRNAVVTVAGRHSLQFTHGVAAKLINCYLKVRFVCGPDWADPKVRALHPPIDRLLLDGLAKDNVGGSRATWRQANQWAWSKFTSDQYQSVIDHIRRVVGDEMWKIEEYWRGHQ